MYDSPVETVLTLLDELGAVDLLRAHTPMPRRYLLDLLDRLERLAEKYRVPVRNGHLYSAAPRIAARPAIQSFSNGLRQTAYRSHPVFGLHGRSVIMELARNSPR